MNRRHQFLLFGGVWLAGCSFLKSFDGYTGASPDAAADPGCPVKTWPTRPVAAPPGASLDLVGAAKELAFYDDAKGAAAGLDIDQQCTCNGGSPACEPQGGASPTCDLPGGVDNQGANVLRALFPTEGLRQGLDRALSGLAVAVSGYNGKPDDDTVGVTIYNVVGVNGKTDGSETAHFDGTDEFIVDAESTVTETDLKPGRYVDTNAYVNHGTLVAHFDLGLKLTLDDGSTPDGVRIVEQLRAASLVGTLQVDGAGLRMPDAQIVGRIPLDTMFSQVGPASTCSDGGLVTRLKGSICPALDVPASPANDGTDAPCEALSFALKLNVVPAKLHAAPGRGAPSDPKCPPQKGLCH